VDDVASTTLWASGSAGVRLVRFAEGYFDPADRAGYQVVDDRADRGHRGNQNDVQRTQHAGVAEDPGHGEPVGDVRARRALARGDRGHRVLQRREDAERGQHHVEHCDRDEQDDEGHDGDHETELHDRPWLDPGEGQLGLPLGRAPDARTPLALAGVAALEGGRHRAR